MLVRFLFRTARRRNARNRTKPSQYRQSQREQQRDALEKLPDFRKRIKLFLDRKPNLVANLAPPKPGYKWRFLLSALNEDRLRRVLGYMLDENEFLSPHGIRSISKIHKDHPYVLRVDSQEYDVSYQPAESESGLFFWRDLILFYEYFHGDHGAGIGAGYQTGWTGLVARLILLSVGLDPKQLLDLEHKPVLRRNAGIRRTAAAGKP